MVLAVLRGELSAADAGQLNGVAEQTIHNWKKAFLDAGRAGLATGGRPRRSSRELELEAENEELRAALGEAHVQLRVWQKGAEYPPIEDLEVIRTDAQLSVSRFAELIGVRRRTYTWRLARHREVPRVPWSRQVGCHAAVTG